MPVPISFEADCCDSELARETFNQLSRGRYAYPASIMPLPLDMEEHLAEHRTFRKRAARCRNRGYRFAEIDRTKYEDDVFAINTSAPERQGRPMSEGYLAPVRFGPMEWPCPRHGVHTYGVLRSSRRPDTITGGPTEKLVAYTWIYRLGELVLVSQILGHDAHLADDVMYELARGALTSEALNGPGTVFYNLHSSGTPGLRYFKEKLGLRPGRVEWRLR